MPGELNTLRILVVDDHAIIRLGIAGMVEKDPSWKLVGEASTGLEALAKAQELRPDIIIQDITLPDRCGLEILRQLKKLLPATEIIVFTAHSAEELVYQAFDAGARSYLVKAVEIDLLVEAIRAVAAHKPYFTPWVSEIIYRRYRASGPHGERPGPCSELTPREREAVKIIAEGNSNKDLAAHLGVSLRTAESHRAAIMHKLGLQTIGELIRYALRNGIIES